MKMILKTGSHGAQGSSNAKKRKSKINRDLKDGSQSCAALPNDRRWLASALMPDCQMSDDGLGQKDVKTTLKRRKRGREMRRAQNF